MNFMTENFKLVKNIGLPQKESDIYGNVDGLSLQNLFYVRNGRFPSCYLFDYNQRTNSDASFDVPKMAEFLIKNVPADENMEFITYYTEVLGAESEKDAVGLGICIILNKSNIYARFEKSVTESYILFDNKNFEDVQKLVKVVLTFYVVPEKTDNTAYRLCFSRNGYYLDKTKVKHPEGFDVKKLYNDSFLKEDAKIHDFLNANEKSGLVILHGERGTGKSSYIRSLVKDFPDKKFVFVPASLVHLFGDPSFGSFLSSLANHVIILEDCENAIRDRKINGNTEAVSLLLNLTDGLLSDDLGMKFICTFNDDMKNIDSALLRKGRLIAKYEFKPLEKTKAEAILKELGFEAELTKPMTLADLFNFGEDSYDDVKKSII